MDNEKIEEKNNYTVHIVMDRTLFIEGVSSKSEAEERAIAYLDNLLISGIKEFVKITSEKSGEK